MKVQMHTSLEPKRTSCARLTLQVVLFGVITLTLFSALFISYIGLPRSADLASTTAAHAWAKANPTGTRFAYMLYATTKISLCNAVIMAHNIRRLGTPPSIAIVILASVKLDSHPTSEWSAALDAANAVQVPVEPWISSSLRGRSSVWWESLTKLRIFEERGYDKVVYLDADMWLHRNLDHLFMLKRNNDVNDDQHENPPRSHQATLDQPKATSTDVDSSMLWAPRAYYISPQPFFASTLMVFTPSNARFRQLYDAVTQSTRQDYFDMDVLNDVWDPVTFLPSHYVVLNSELLNSPSLVFEFANASDRIAHTYAHHFSALPNGTYGKPWEVDRPVGHKWRTKRKAAPLFYQLFDMYLDANDRLCPWLQPRDVGRHPPQDS
ncbi:hypothetical protein DYB31_010927 [Aphanomyces astaci]|uniref:Nucleotide-diphospho-sugar transferase domain-containing protein n=1 Tax=Aphanomyces astaci TaxID=112090 RepID=A0A397FKT9_APHAT|nr:hypothetical protein DYB31_010927 [Aphanomyces astaci]